MSEENKRGANGGNARAKKLTPEQRSSIAKEAAKKRWAKKKDPLKADIHCIAPTISGGRIAEAIIYGPKIEEVAVKPEPVPDISISTSIVPREPIPSPQPRKPRPKQMPKAFKGASSYAEKRLAEAIKERAEYMGRVAALNAEIPSLVQVIRALGTSAIPSEALQAYPMQTPNYAAPTVGNNTPVEQVQNIPNPIDPALFSANSNPLPGLVPAAAQAPLIPNTAGGGAADLDYVPRDDEGPGLPKMGGGWV
jgi:hypothetical protein